MSTRTWFKSSVIWAVAILALFIVAIIAGLAANDSVGADVSDLEYPPVVEDSGAVISGTESNTDPRTPPVVSGQQPLTSWADAEKFFGQPDWQWYIEGLNARASKTGFDWSDVQQWADETNVEVRLIHAFGRAASDSDEEIRAEAAEDVGADVANKLRIVRHSGEVLINTRGFGHHEMQDFTDNRSIVRVSLAPLVYDECGKVTGVSADSGVFVDCYNLWWIVKPPCSTTTTSSSTTTTSSTSTTSTTVPHTSTTEGKGPVPTNSPTTMPPRPSSTTTVYVPPTVVTPTTAKPPPAPSTTVAPVPTTIVF